MPTFHMPFTLNHHFILANSGLDYDPLSLHHSPLQISLWQRTISPKLYFNFNIYQKLSILLNFFYFSYFSTFNIYGCQLQVSASVAQM